MMPRIVAVVAFASGLVAPGAGAIRLLFEDPGPGAPENVAITDSVALLVLDMRRRRRSFS
jgi:hypothetical protein